MNKRLRNDFILLFGILFIAGVLFSFWFFSFKKEGKKAVVYHGENIILTLDLYKKQRVTVDGDISKVTLEVNYGNVSVIESGCPNQICVHTGEKSKEHDVITCLPNRITIVITGGDSNE